MTGITAAGFKRGKGYNYTDKFVEGQDIPKFMFNLWVGYEISMRISGKCFNDSLLISITRQIIGNSECLVKSVKSSLTWS